MTQHPLAIENLVRRIGLKRVRPTERPWLTGPACYASVIWDRYVAAAKPRKLTEADLQRMFDPTVSVEVGPGAPSGAEILLRSVPG